MLRLTLLVVALSGMAPLFVGCACLDRPYLPESHCGSWDPVLGSCGVCGTCEGGCGGHTPASYMKHKLTCGSGCGDIYWDEWLSDPPDPCDPCDDCGNWTGPPACCPPSFWQQVASGWCNLWGHRGDACGCGEPMPCSDCGHAPLQMMKGELIVPGKVAPSIGQESILRSARFQHRQ